MALKVGSSDSCDTEKLKDPLMVVLVGADGDEQHLAHVLLGKALVHGHLKKKC